MVINPKQLITILVINFICWSCANVVTPVGGTEDITPPEPELFYPENYSTNFSANSISIKFKDYIQLNDVFNQVLISPPLEETPDFKVKGKTLLINLKSELKDSTTYTINFGQSIKDITEGNILNNFTYVFSTGNELDSLQVSGKITDLFTNSIPKSVYAVLYLANSDSSFLKEKPYYFTKADATGTFTIKNIKQGVYNLYALEDQNFNYYYDLPNENIAFQSSPLMIDSNIENQKLKLFSEDKLKQYVIEIKSPGYGESRIIFSKKADSVKINYTGENPDQGYFIHNSGNDTITYWNSNYKLKQHSFLIQFDTSNLQKEIQIKQIPEDSNFLKQKNTFTSNLPIQKSGKQNEWDLNKTIRLQFNHPLSHIDTGKISILEDSTTLFYPEVVIDSADPRIVTIPFKSKESTSYKIKIPQNISTDIFGLKNDSISAVFQTKSKTDYSKLSVKITNHTGSSILFQMLSADQKIIYSATYIPFDLFINEQYTVVVPFLIPGIYKLKVIIDSDENEKWTTGNLIENKFPEAVYFFPVDQNIRANWENEIDWVLE